LQVHHAQSRQLPWPAARVAAIALVVAFGQTVLLPEPAGSDGSTCFPRVLPSHTPFTGEERIPPPTPEIPGDGARSGLDPIPIARSNPAFDAGSRRAWHRDHGAAARD